MVQYEHLVIKIYKCIENVKTRLDNNFFIIVIALWCCCDGNVSCSVIVFLHSNI